MKKLEFREAIIWRSDEFKPSEVDAVLLQFVPGRDRSVSGAVLQGPGRAGIGRAEIAGFVFFTHSKMDQTFQLLSRISHVSSADFPCLITGEYLDFLFP